MTERNDHEVAAGVGIAVHHDVAAFPLAEDQAIPARHPCRERSPWAFSPGYRPSARAQRSCPFSNPQQDERPLQRSFLNIGDRSDHHPAETSAHEPADYNEMNQKDKDYFGAAPVSFDFPHD